MLSVEARDSTAPTVRVPENVAPVGLLPSEMLTDVAAPVRVPRASSRAHGRDGAPPAEVGSVMNRWCGSPPP
jgi:hypothetical protein